MAILTNEPFSIWFKYFDKEETIELIDPVESEVHISRSLHALTNQTGIPVNEMKFFLLYLCVCLALYTVI